MTYEINIGLPPAYEGIVIDEIIDAIEHSGLICHRFEIYGPRLVAEVTGNPSTIDRVLTALAISLDREAIAAWHCHRREGQLYGPKANAYGPFESSKFRHLSKGDPL